jgi:MoxR-like ATPase
MHPEIEQLQRRLERHGYIAERPVATAIQLAAVLGRPLLVEGPTGVGKTAIAGAMSSVLDTHLIRLQCYEGIDTSSALYEWNYQKQLLDIRLAEASGSGRADIFSVDYLLKRPLLEAITSSTAPVLLIDEVDRSDEEFEAFLLELLSDWQVSVPELGTLTARQIPYTVLTSNRTRDLADALRRRCLYLWIDYPSFDKELAIVRARVPGAGEAISARIVAFVQMLRRLPLEKAPGVSETLDWVAALLYLDRNRLGPEVIESTLGVLLKHVEDQRRVRSRFLQALTAGLGGFESGGITRAVEQMEAVLAQS